MQDIKLKIRHAKRGNQKSLDLSGLGLSDIPVDVTQLTMLESIDVSNNKLINLKRIEQLPNLREINAANNLINSLHQELLDMWSIETIHLYGNPIVNQVPQLAQIENDQDLLKKTLQQYFGTSGSAGIMGLKSLDGPGLSSNYSQQQLNTGSQGYGAGGGSSYASKPNFGAGASKPGGFSGSSSGPYSGGPSMSSGSSLNKQPSSVGVGYQQQQQPASSYTAQDSLSKPSFLQQQPEGQDVIALKRKIQILETENKQLKEMAENPPYQKASTTVTNDDRNWMSSISSGPSSRPGMGMERPVTASS